MTNGAPVWEFGKCAFALVMLASIVRHPVQRRQWVLPIAYFAVLLPSAFSTLGELGFAEARQPLSFNLSGPFCLAVAVAFFSSFRVSRQQLSRVFLSFIAPVAAVAAIPLYSVLTATTIEFGERSSNFTASGGFGPNQVSAVLGLGAVLALLVALERTIPPALRYALLVVATWFLAQASLTFSRTGVYLALGSVGLALWYLLREAQTRFKVSLVVGVLGTIFALILWPAMDRFTKGALSARFSDARPTGRDEIARSDVELWLLNPLLGVGVGASAHERLAVLQREAGAHTEFTRLLAEHGAFGLVAIGSLFGMAVWVLRRAQGSVAKKVVAVGVGWTFMFMLVSGMRLAAPAFMFGLACSRFALAPAEGPTLDSARTPRLSARWRERLRKRGGVPRQPAVARATSQTAVVRPAQFKPGA